MASSRIDNPIKIIKITKTSDSYGGIEIPFSSIKNFNKILSITSIGTVDAYVSYGGIRTDVSKIVCYIVNWDGSRRSDVTIDLIITYV